MNSPLTVRIPRTLKRAGLVNVPAVILATGEAGTRRFFEFFTANIRNPNTRMAYYRAVVRFFNRLEQRHVPLAQVQPMIVAAYIEDLQTQVGPATVKQNLAAIRMLYDWLVVGQIVPHNPASSVRGPKHVVKKGKTPVLTAEEARHLLDSIDTSHVVGLRDRALIGVMVYSFARVSAVAQMKVKDYFPSGKRFWLRLHEKGGKYHEVPCHHNAEEYVDAYLQAANIADQKDTPLFRTTYRKTRQLTDRGFDRRNVLDMIKRRGRAAGLREDICCHTFRATGITAYLDNGGTIEKAQQIAAHESPRTTKLYDRTNDQLTLDEIEKIII